MVLLAGKHGTRWLTPTKDGRLEPSRNWQAHTLHDRSRAWLSEDGTGNNVDGMFIKGRDPRTSCSQHAMLHILDTALVKNVLHTVSNLSSIATDTIFDTKSSATLFSNVISCTGCAIFSSRFVLLCTAASPEEAVRQGAFVGVDSVFFRSNFTAFVLPPSFI